MKTVVPLITVVIAALAVFWLIRSRVARQLEVTVSDIPRVLEVMSASTATPTFAAFVFNTYDRPGSDDAVNIQLSIESGRPGFDWVLIAKRNIEDKDRFIDFARAAGFSPQPMEMNGVRYLRVEGGDIGNLCAEVITRMYNVSRTTLISLIPEGFSWTS